MFICISLLCSRYNIKLMQLTSKPGCVIVTYMHISTDEAYKVLFFRTTMTNCAKIVYYSDLCNMYKRALLSHALQEVLMLFF